MSTERPTNPNPTVASEARVMLYEAARYRWTDSEIADRFDLILADAVDAARTEGERKGRKHARMVIAGAALSGALDDDLADALLVLIPATSSSPTSDPQEPDDG